MRTIENKNSTSVENISNRFNIFARTKNYIFCIINVTRLSKKNEQFGKKSVK